MSAENKAANKVTEAKGKIKKKAGQATGDTSLEAEGRAEETKGDLKQTGGKIKGRLQEVTRAPWGTAHEPKTTPQGSTQ
jgi:uncharacterized protein YjbJ (UPF0337 family)